MLVHLKCYYEDLETKYIRRLEHCINLIHSANTEILELIIYP